MATRIVLGEHNLLERAGVCRLLADDPAIAVVAAVADIATLRAAVAEHQPDVVITEIRLPPEYDGEGIQLAVELRESAPQISVVVLSEYADPLYALALFERGSDRRAYLLKQRIHNRAALTAAIHAVAAGGSIVDPRVVDELARARAQAASSPLNELTAREREVLIEIAQGKSNGAIADSLVLTKRALAKTHQCHLPQARSRQRRGHQQARQGRTDVARRGRHHLAKPSSRRNPRPRPASPAQPAYRVSGRASDLRADVLNTTRTTSDTRPGAASCAIGPPPEVEFEARYRGLYGLNGAAFGRAARFGALGAVRS